MASTKIKKNDLVVILSGKDKGKTGAVLETNYKKQTVIVKDVNKKTKHHKPSQENQEGKIEKKEFPIHISNVMRKIKAQKQVKLVEKLMLNQDKNKDTWEKLKKF